MAGKGDTPRPVDPKKWAENWDRIFAPKPARPVFVLRETAPPTCTGYPAWVTYYTSEPA